LDGSLDQTQVIGQTFRWMHPSCHSLNAQALRTTFQLRKSDLPLKKSN